jgi:hypothetical protein
MFVLREHHDNGPIVARSDTLFGVYRDDDGARFADIDQNGAVEFGDHYIGRLEDTIVFSTTVDGEQKPLYWLEEMDDDPSHPVRP